MATDDRRSATSRLLPLTAILCTCGVNAQVAPAQLTIPDRGVSSGQILAAPDSSPVLHQPVLMPTVRLSATGATNPGLQPDGHSDLTLDVSASLGVRYRTARLTVDGQVGLHAISYARATAANTVLPDADLVLRSTLVDRWLYLDGRVFSTQTSADPFGAAVTPDSIANRITVTRYELSPRIQHEFTPAVTGLLRWQRGWTRYTAPVGVTTPAADATNDDVLVRLESKPQPLGWRVEANHQTAAYANVVGDPPRFGVLRTTALMTPGADWLFGLTVGHDQVRYGALRESANLYGVVARFQPSERTTFQGQVEHRYFGVGTDLEVRHRSPFISLVAHAVSQPSLLSTSQALLSAGSTSALLDAMLTTREPDPVLRAARVRDLMVQFNLPATLNGAIEVYANQPRLERGGDVTLGLRSRATTWTVSASVRSFVSLPGVEDPLFPDFQSTRQASLVLGVAQQFTPAIVLNADLRWNRLKGLEARAGQRTDNRSAGLALTRQLSPHSSLSVAARRRLLDSVATGQGDADDSSLALVVAHRF